jgi:hypothetical protein
MYFPTRSASSFVLARTRLWTLKPEPVGYQNFGEGV